MRFSAEHELLCAAGFFGDISGELQLFVVRAIEERMDRAALCLAVPPLGLAALRTLPTYGEDVLLR